ncbi:MAG TPA: hypothetical protein VFX16_08235 [Pseudonocardiaceae bacterium]|nr:hypothetical protein [Pseudonocardiaceae bacterium]
MPPRVLECSIAMEATVADMHSLGDGSVVACEVDVRRVHVHESVRMAGHPNRIDPDRWRPLIMSFQRFYGLTGQIHPSRLSTIDEEWYRD